ncbi:hypothetical protein MTR67_047872 [Solanum verrucosum]|uniref:Uncharacterized protein n=1 Tax=Solanum verrucosum TaxID=315347 RepID=A0AAF0UXE7_SOLVR|nr:hypothetical protein MTR67_047872 [Solanum verrucosum]
MAPGGRVFKQTTLTGETIQDTQSLDESNNHTPAVNTNDSTRIRNSRGKTRGKGLEKMKKAQGRKMKIEIPIGKGRPTKPDQSAKLSNELGIIARNFLLLPNKWKELTREDKDAALIRCHEEARTIEVPELTPENWNRLCDMWINPEHKSKTNPEGVEPDRIEFYKHTHYMSEKGWSSLEAETHYVLCFHNASFLASDMCDIAAVRIAHIGASLDVLLVAAAE